MEKKTLDKLKYLINKRKSVEEICDILNVEVQELYEMVLYLKALGENYDLIESMPKRISTNEWVKKIKKSTLSISDEFNSEIQITKTPVQKICLLSDIHYGSLYDRPDIISHIYHECEKRGIAHIFCSGDFTNGNYRKRPFFASQSRIYQSQDMIDYVANIHPYSDYIKFYTIAGNHDDSYLYTEGIDICSRIAKLRPDIVYLGRSLADVTIGQTKMRIYHGCDKKRKSIEDRVTRFYNKIDGEFKPNILQIGHIHHSLYLPLESCHIFQTAALMDPMQFEDHRQFPCERSCWYVSLEYDDNGLPYKVVPEIEIFGHQRLRK